MDGGEAAELVERWAMPRSVLGAWLVLLLAAMLVSAATASRTSGPADGPIVWRACRPGPGECGTLEVPLDYSKPDGRTIDLALDRVPATDPT